jgi:enoyl-CoA hydratase
MGRVILHVGHFLLEVARLAIHYERDEEHVVLITIDRPEARNSLDMEHFFQLRTAWERYAQDSEAWVAIVTGVGDAFCVGADLKKYIPEITKHYQLITEGKAEEIGGYKLDDGMKAVLRDVDLYKPVIAAINGVCVAGGMELLGGCDIRVAATGATFGVMEPKRGLFAGGGTTVRLPRQVPFPAAMELLLCADRVPAERALQMGLLNEVVKPELLMDTARSYARRIAVNAPFAIQKTKESVLRGLAEAIPRAYEIEMEIAGEVFGTEDAKEGPKAFAEKRAPVWKGR